MQTAVQRWMCFARLTLNRFSTRHTRCTCTYRRRYHKSGLEKKIAVFPPTAFPLALFKTRP